MRTRRQVPAMGTAPDSSKRRLGGHYRDGAALLVRRALGRDFCFTIAKRPLVGWM